MRNVSLFVLIALMAALSGCGQKGPLVLPDAQHPHKKPKFPAQKTQAPPATPAPAPPSAAPDASGSPDSSAPSTAPDPAPSPAPQG